MSISTLLFFLLCYLMYRLGDYNARHPGAVWRALREVGAWTWKMVNP